MADEALYYGTGRRKNAVARVRLVPGTGKVTINGRDGEEYFGREALFNFAMTPFKVTDTAGHFDVKARIDGGGFFLCHWDGTTETEERIKEETKATIRCIPLGQPDEPGVCMVTGKPSARRVIIARNY